MQKVNRTLLSINRSLHYRFDAADMDILLFQLNIYMFQPCTLFIRMVLSVLGYWEVWGTPYSFQLFFRESYATNGIMPRKSRIDGNSGTRLRDALREAGLPV